ncbi:MAG: radical SAM protein [bacterium]|nr:radical SAM protein [bacterium]
MLSQILYPLFKEHLHITNVVFMGMGEPFDNYEAVLKTIRMINDKKGINIGMRKITVSTAGIVPRIMEFAELKSQVRLSISLHSAIDETRSFLMPINKKYPLPELIKACQFYRRMTGRKLTFEYVLFENVNDNEKHALALADLSLLIDADVNIIPFSKIPGCKLTRTSIWKTEKFLQTLKKKRVRATIRKSRGSDINAACGQLAGIKK